MPFSTSLRWLDRVSSKLSSTGFGVLHTSRSTALRVPFGNKARWLRDLCQLFEVFEGSRIPPKCWAKNRCRTAEVEVHRYTMTRRMTAVCNLLSLYECLRFGEWECAATLRGGAWNAEAQSHPLFVECHFLSWPFHSANPGSMVFVKLKRVTCRLGILNKLFGRCLLGLDTAKLLVYINSFSRIEVHFMKVSTEVLSTCHPNHSIMLRPMDLEVSLSHSLLLIEDVEVQWKHDIMKTSAGSDILISPWNSWTPKTKGAFHQIVIQPQPWFLPSATRPGHLCRFGVSRSGDDPQRLGRAHWL